MPNITQVTLANGVPTTGTGTVSTIDALMADGGQATIGAKADATWDGSSAASEISIVRYIGTKMEAARALLAGTLTVATHAVTQSGSWVLSAGTALIGSVKVSDGTSTAAVKAASTLPAATDPALVVTVRDVNPNGPATPANSAPVVGADQYSTHKEVGASATATVLGATGATGDYLSHVTVFPGTAGCGVVTILDNATVVGTFAGGGTTALPSLVPFMIPIGAFSTSGAWKITTGANVTVTAVGKFT